MKRLFLIDGNSYVYRAFFATPHLSNSKGMPTNAIYAFINMLKKLRNEQKPDGLVVIFDSKAPSFRMEISNEYKAQRPSMPSNMSIQFPYIKMIIKGMGIPVLEKEGFEADDVIATLVRKVGHADDHVYIVTSDKDMMQLVSDSVTICDTMKNAMLGEKEVVEKFGISPRRIADFLALSGDTSDNIPGVAGIGDKTARDLLTEFESIEDIYDHLERVQKPVMREKLRASRDMAFMSKSLATLRTDVPLNDEETDLAFREQDNKGLRSIFRELEFMGLYREIPAESESERPVWGPLALHDVAGKSIALLCAISGRCPYDVQIGGFALSDGKGIFHSNDEEELFRALDEASDVIVHNAKPLWIDAKKKGRAIDRPLFDTMLAVYLINALRKEYSLETILEEFIDVAVQRGEDEEGLTSRVPYLIELGDVLQEKMKAMEVLDLFFRVEMPLVEVLAHMECAGVKVDRHILHDLSRDFDKRLATIMKKVHELAGEPFNINSPQQLSHILFDRLNLPPVKKTKTSFSTDNEVLQILSEQHPLPAEILEYRTLAKLKGTYIDTLHTFIHPQSGRIHASFNQMVVATGRLSSSDPNLQNIPIKGVEGRKIREAFIAEEGFLLLSSDYSQIELRVLAHMSQDEVLVNAFLTDEDIHAAVAQDVFKVSPSEVTGAMRRSAKVINFGIVYGISGYGLSRELGVGPKEAQAYIDRYFERHRGVKAYIERTMEEARENGFVRTLFGRVRYIPEIHNQDMSVRQFGERTAMNTPIQGTAADIIKMAMVAIYRRMKEKRVASRLIMQIHDELVFEVREDEMELMEEIVRHGMEHACELCVPLKVTMGKGKNWALAHD
jgi:DNA polymerase-1